MSRSIVISICFLVLGIASPASTDSAQNTSARGQIYFVNRTSITLNFEVDGVVVCPGPVRMNLTCTTQQAPGSRKLRAKGARGWSKSVNVDLKAGRTCTWTVTDDDEDEIACGG
jgi:hypothetical protein